jgi:hypothetical protein
MSRGLGLMLQAMRERGKREREEFIDNQQVAESQ